MMIDMGSGGYFLDSQWALWGWGLVIMLCAMSVYAADDEGADILRDRNTEWQLLKTDKMHNISTFFKREDKKRYRSFKANAIYEQNLDVAACHQLDAYNFKKWFMNTEESRILKRLSDTEFYMYLKFNTPFGVPPRDLVVHVLIAPYTSQKGVLTVSYRASPDYIPAVAGVIRMPVYEVTTRLTPLANGYTQEDTEGYAESGGSGMPTWLVNYFQRQMPYANALARGRDLASYHQSNANCPFKYKE